MRRGERSRRGPSFGVLRGCFTQVVAGLSAMVGVGAAVYALISRLEDNMLYLLLGSLMVIVIIVVVAVLFIGRDVIQAYLIQRIIQQDDLNDLKQMAATFRLMKGQDVNVRLPSRRRRRGGYGVQQFFGSTPDFRDTLDGDGDDVDNIDIDSEALADEEVVYE
jgi:hypothetical protein